MNEFVQKGKEIIAEAIALDEEKKYEEALDKYVFGIKHFITGMKCTWTYYNKIFILDILY